MITRSVQLFITRVTTRWSTGKTQISPRVARPISVRRVMQLSGLFPDTSPRDRTIQLNDRRGRNLSERIIERGDAAPVRFRSSTRASVTCGDGGLHRVRAKGASEFFGTLKGGETAMDEELIPTRAVLIQE